MIPYPCISHRKMVFICYLLYLKIPIMKKKTDLSKSLQISQRNNFFKLGLHLYVALIIILEYGQNGGFIWITWSIWYCIIENLTRSQWYICVDESMVVLLTGLSNDEYHQHKKELERLQAMYAVMTYKYESIIFLWYSYQLSESQRISNEVSGAYYNAACRKAKQDVKNLESNGFSHTDIDNLKLDMKYSWNVNCSILFTGSYLILRRRK